MLCAQKQWIEPNFTTVRHPYLGRTRNEGFGLWGHGLGNISTDRPIVVSVQDASYQLHPDDTRVDKI